MSDITFDVPDGSGDSVGWDVPSSSEGPQGPPGVVAATAPVTYDDETRTVALAIGDGLSVVDGQLVADGGGGGVSLGETSTTAYRGDRGKTAYDHSQVTTGNPHGTTASDVGAVPTSRTINGFDLTTNRTLTAADVGAAVAPTVARRTTNLGRTSTTALAADTELVFAAAANKLYRIDALLIASSASTTPDIKFGIDAPAGSTISAQVTGLASSGTGLSGAGRVCYLNATTDEADFALDAGRYVFPLVGYVRTSGTSGNISVTWAQRSSNATASTLHADSCLAVTLIA